MILPPQLPPSLPLPIPWAPVVVRLDWFRTLEKAIAEDAYRTLVDSPDWEGLEAELLGGYGVWFKCMIDSALDEADRRAAR